jgi:hypothetical protein
MQACPHQMAQSTWNFRLSPELYLEMKEYLAEYEYLQLMNCSQQGFDDVKKQTQNIRLSLDMMRFVCKAFIVKAMRRLNSLSIQSTNGFPEILETTISFRPNFLIHISFDNSSAECERALEILDIPRPYIEGCSEQLSFMSLMHNSRLVFAVTSPTSESTTATIESFNDALHSEIPSNQLRQYHLKGHYEANHDFSSSFTSLHTLKFSNYELLVDVSALGKIHYLSIDRCPNLQDISALTDNYRLEIFNCKSINISDLSSLKNIVYLQTDLFQQSIETNTTIGSFSLDKTRILDLNELTVKPDNHMIHCLLRSRCLWKLSLSKIEGLMDVQSIAHIPIIYLQQCRDLEDISAFHESKNKVIEVLDCWRITDFRSLKNIFKVKIHLCSNFVNACDVENVSILSLVSCHSIRDFSMLGKAQSLEINYCRYFTTMAGLLTVEKLKIFPHSTVGSIDLKPLFDEPSRNEVLVIDVTCLPQQWKRIMKYYDLARPQISRTTDRPPVSHATLLRKKQPVVEEKKNGTCCMS